MTTNTQAPTKEQLAAKKIADKKADAKAERNSLNREIWDELCVTNPKYTKDFNNGTYRGKSISPMYIFQRLTELFGPNGMGWGWEILSQEIVDAGSEKLCFVTIQGWYKHNGEVHKTSPQIAGEKIMYTTSKGRLIVDDEAFKKAVTDGATKCFTYIGSSADVHLGLHDDSKMAMRIAQASYDNEAAVNAAKLRKKEADIRAAASEIDDAVVNEQSQEPQTQETTQSVVQTQTQVQTQAQPTLDELAAIAPPEFVKMISSLLDPNRIQRGMEWAKGNYKEAELNAALAFANAKIASLQG